VPAGFGGRLRGKGPQPPKADRDLAAQPILFGPDTVCFVMDPSRSGAVLARHAGIDEKTGQLLPDDDGGPRRLVISSDFYAVYESAGKKADGLVNLYCWAHYPEGGIMPGTAAKAGIGKG